MQVAESWKEAKQATGSVSSRNSFTDAVAIKDM
jgi:hypothetical protein